LASSEGSLIAPSLKIPKKSDFFDVILRKELPANEKVTQSTQGNAKLKTPFLAPPLHVLQNE
jgi:hypothetical protein